MGKGMTDMEKGQLQFTILVVVFLAIVGGIWYYIYNLPENVTKRVLKANAGNHGTNNHTMPIADGWGQNLKYTYQDTKYKKIFTVTSAGEDMQFGTADDMSIERFDHNKSRIIGKYVTDKLKEVGKGVKDSLSEDGNEEHDKEHEGLTKKIGKKLGETIKDLKDGFKEGKGESDQ